MPHGVLQRQISALGEVRTPDDKYERAVDHGEKGGLENEKVPLIVLDTPHSPDRTLDQKTRAEMSACLDYDFSQVRIHTDVSAARSADVVSALAYTVGSDVVFARSAYQPGTSSGRYLFAHELAHVVQRSDRVTTPGVTDVSIIR